MVILFMLNFINLFCKMFIGDQFDAVFINACSFDNVFPCPSTEFLQNSTLQNIRSILKDKGFTFYLFC